MKGAMLAVEPALPLVDVSHEVAPQDVMEAAFLLRQVVPYFPAGAVHLVVVDPGASASAAQCTTSWGPTTGCWRC
jgi:S-adenosylmethionine hydrolase